MASSLDYPICTACGTQFSNPNASSQKNCRICLDPRQFVPPSGQSFTTLRDLRKGNYRNVWRKDEHDERVWDVSTEPKFAIGQRAFLLQTKNGNVLWDMIAYIDEETIAKIESLGGLSAIVISHPHYYTTIAEWGRIFNCPVYTAIDDKVWLEPEARQNSNHVFIESVNRTILPGVTAMKVGGHFDGSLVLKWEDKLYIADTLLTVPSAHTPLSQHTPGTSSYAFLYSIPNMIPLPASEIVRMWKILKDVEFSSTYGAFIGMDVRGGDVKGRVLKSAGVQIEAMGGSKELLLIA